MPVIPKSNPRKKITVEDYLQPLDLNEKKEDSFRTAASRSRSFVDRLPQNVVERKRKENRPRCCTFSMKGQFSSDFDRFSFTVTASPRFEDAKKRMFFFLKRNAFFKYHNYIINCNF